MNVFTLFASLKLDKSDYEKGVQEAKKEGEDFAEHTEKKVSVKAVAGWAAIVAVILKAVQALKKLITESINYADTVSDLAAQYGVTTDAISEMQYIADQSSTSIEGLTSSMSMLYMRAKQDGEAFQQLGISVKDTSGNFKSMDELFWETVGALNSIDNEGEKSAIMLDLFGRSAMNVGEVLRKTNSEISTMRKEAHNLGVVMDKETVKFASDFNDEIAVLKLQSKSVFASMIAGAPDAEERFDKFLENLLEKLDKYLPKILNFVIRLLFTINIEMRKRAPVLLAELLSTLIDTIFSVNWVEVGLNMGKAMLEGIVNILVSGLNSFLKIFGVEIPKVDFGISSGSDYLSGIDKNYGSSYEISENVRQDITVKVEASGDSTVSKETAEKTAEALAPYIDKILGGK